MTPVKNSAIVIPDALKNPLVKLLNREHPQFTEIKDTWTKLMLLYEGGYRLKKNATQFLRRRARELQEIYTARIDGFSYHNILAGAFGWYQAALFKNPPLIQGKTVDAKEKETGDIPDNLNTWYTEFQKDCDRKKTNFVDLIKELWTDSVLYGVSYLLVDLPSSSPDTTTLKDQQMAGQLDKQGRPNPYLCHYDPLSIINWEVDEYGILLWAVVAVQRTTQDFVADVKTVDTWYYFDRQKFLVYEWERRQGAPPSEMAPDTARATLVDYGYHALRAANMVPLLRFDVPGSLWLADRAYLPVLDHLNQDNSYSWLLYMSNLAMPVIMSDSAVELTLSEAGAIRLPANAKYEWSEPSGRSAERSACRVKELREEIYRAMYLTYQGKSSTATADGASGASKEMDMMPANDIMNEFGAMTISFMQSTLNAVSIARGDQAVRWDVRGMSFGKTATIDELQRTEAALSLGIPSDTYERETWKTAAFATMPDANPEVLDAISTEIDKAPTQEERMLQQAQQRTGQYKGTMDAAVQQFNKPPQPMVPPKPKRKRADAA